MGQVEPGGAFVVEVGQGALGQQLGVVFVARDKARVADRADTARVGIVDVARPGAGRRAGAPEDSEVLPFSGFARLASPNKARLIWRCKSG